MAVTLDVNWDKQRTTAQISFQDDEKKYSWDNIGFIRKIGERWEWQIYDMSSDYQINGYAETSDVAIVDMLKRKGQELEEDAIAARDTADLFHFGWKGVTRRSERGAFTLGEAPWLS